VSNDGGRYTIGRTETDCSPLCGVCRYLVRRITWLDLLLVRALLGASSTGPYVVPFSLCQTKFLISRRSESVHNRVGVYDLACGLLALTRL
jgi:hypothetical protein